MHSKPADSLISIAQPSIKLFEDFRMIFFCEHNVKSRIDTLGGNRSLKQSQNRWGKLKFSLVAESDSVGWGTLIGWFMGSRISPFAL